MNIIISIVTFLIVLFIYLHIYYHIKISNYLEVYDIQNLSKERLEEICDLRQPVLFEFDSQNICENDFIYYVFISVFYWVFQL